MPTAQPFLHTTRMRTLRCGQGAAERSGIICGMIIKGCRIGGDPAHGVLGTDVQPLTCENLRLRIKEAVQADEHHFALTVQLPLPGWRRSVKPLEGRGGGSHVREAMHEVGRDPARNLRGVQCSWCFQPTTHVCVEPGIVSRDVCVCQSCFRQTVICKNFSNACNGAARRHQSGSDSECALCMGLVETWLDAPVWPEHWCSWCFQRTPHELVEKKKIGRSFYSCTKCGRPTQKCCVSVPGGNPGQSAMSRAGNDHCFKCEGLIEDWDEPENCARFQRIGSCSWCFKECVHTLVSRHSVKRDRFQCSNCSMETARCSPDDDCDGMVRAGGVLSTDAHCVSCNAHLDWPTLRAKADSQFDRQRTRFDMEQELARPSKYKQVGPLKLTVSASHSSLHTNRYRVIRAPASMGPGLRAALPPARFDALRHAEPRCCHARLDNSAQALVRRLPRRGLAHRGRDDRVHEQSSGVAQPGRQELQLLRHALPRRCAPRALSPSPLIFSYKSEKSLCGAGVHAMPDIQDELERRFKCKRWDDSLARCQDGSDPHLRYDLPNTR